MNKKQSAFGNAKQEDEATLQLRRRSTCEVLPQGIHRPSSGPMRHSSRSRAVAAVRQVTKMLSRNYTAPNLKTSNSPEEPQIRRAKTVSHLTVSNKSISQVRKLASQVSTKEKFKNIPSRKAASDKKDSKSASASQTVSKKKHGKNAGGKILWYTVGAYLAVRTDSESEYYLCRSKRHIFNCTKQARIQWLDTFKQEKLWFSYSYEDSIDPASVLMEVDLEKKRYKGQRCYCISEKTHEEILGLLKLTLDVEKGNIPIGSLNNDEIEEVIQIDQPVKKPRLTKSVSQKLRDKAAKQAAKERKSQEKTETRKRKTAKKRDDAEKSVGPKVDDLKLHPRPDIKVLEKDPLFESRDPMPYVSKKTNSRLVFRAISMKDNKLLKKLLRDRTRIYELFCKSVDNDESPLEAAAKSGDPEIFETMLHEYRGSKFIDRKVNNHNETSMIDRLDTGSYNRRSFGIRYIRKIQASRGSREGNNAFTISETQSSRVGEEDLIRKYLNDHQLETMIACLSKLRKNPDLKWTDYLTAWGFAKLLLTGSHKRAGKFVEAELKKGKPYFNNLFKDVLLLETEDLTNCSFSNVSFESRATGNLTPLHCACVNPNKKYLQRLLAVASSVNISDNHGRRPIHYAATCSSPGPLQLLLDWGANLQDSDKKQLTPLYYAIKANRVHNVELLLKRKGTETLADQNQLPEVNRLGMSGLTPLHRAIKYGSLEMAKCLIANGADVNGKLSVSNMQVTPLMFAAQRGNLQMVRLLVDSGATVQQMDRLERTAVIHAAKNGATSVLSYLLHLGASGERADNSGNTPLHYAAAYGWLFTVRLLLQWGADPNAKNMWTTSPVLVAFLKGHSGIVRELLNHEKTDINFTDDSGKTMVFHGCESDLRQPDLYEQIQYLVEDQGALCTIQDMEGQTPLHAMIQANQDKFVGDMAVRQGIKITELLIKHGCDVDAVDERGNTVAMLAIGLNTHPKLVEVLLKTGSKVLTPSSEGEPTSTILHQLIVKVWKGCDRVQKKRGNALEILRLLTKKCPEETKIMKAYVDSNGYTPLLKAASHSTYGQCSQIRIPEKPDEERLQKECQCKIWDDYFHFVESLVTDSDINAKVGKMFFSLDDMPAEGSPNWYHNHYHAGKTAAQIIITQTDPEFDENCNIVTDSDNKQVTFGGRVFKMLLARGTDVNSPNINGNTLFCTMVLADQRRPELVHFLVNKAGCDVNGVIYRTEHKETLEYSPLIQACIHFDAKIVLALIECGADIKSTSPKMDMPCLQCIMAYHYREKEKILQVIDALADKGCDFNSLDKKKRTSVHYAIRRNEGGMNQSCELEVKLIQLGVEIGRQNYKGQTVMHYVFKKKKTGYRSDYINDPAKLVKLIGQTMTKKQVNLADYEGKTALHLAAYQGATMCCMYLLRIGANVDVEDMDGNTPLSLAVLKSHDGCATMLIQNGAPLKISVITLPDSVLKERRKNVKLQLQSLVGQEKSAEKATGNEKDSDGDAEMSAKKTEPWHWHPFKKTKQKDDGKRSVPLYQAAIEKNLNGVAMFVTDTDVKKSGLKPEDFIHIAIETCKYNMVFHLVCTTIDKTILQHVDTDRRNFLHRLALSCEKVNSQQDVLLKIASSLIQAGVQPDQTDKYGCTPTQYAILNRHFYFANFLAEKCGGYDLDWTDGFGRNHIAAALWRSYSKGIDGNICSFIETLLEGEDKRLIDCLFDFPLSFDVAGLPDLPDPDYWKRYPVQTTALITALYRANGYEIVQRLLKLGADPNQGDGNKTTPLMHAVMMNYTKMVKLLLNNNFDPRYPEKYTGSYKEQEVKKQVRDSNKFMGAFRIKDADCGDDGEENGEESESSEDEEEKTKKEKQKSGKKDSDSYKGHLPVAKTSPVKLELTNKDKQSVAHLVAKPLLWGSFDNEEIAYLLAHAGLKITAGHVTAAVEAGANKVLEAWKPYSPQAPRSKKSSFAASRPVEDGIPPLKEKLPPFKAAADKVLKKYDSTMEVEDRYVHEIDEFCNVESGELMFDEDLGVYYDVLMTRVDVGRGAWGKYNFYQLQLIHQPSKSLYVLFTRWGRIEDDGQFQHTPFKEKATAVKEFQKIFRSKSGNKWTDIKNYEQKPKKYRLVEDMARKAPPPLKDVDIVLDSLCKSLLPGHLFSVIKNMMDPKQLQLSMRRTHSLNTESLPFGQLNKERLCEGKRILEAIEKFVQENEGVRKISKGNQALDAEIKVKFQDNLEKIVQLSNDFYHVIPQRDYVCEKIGPLDSPTAVTHQMYDINNLLDYEVACKMLLAAMAHREVINPVDYVYRSLDCKLELMQEDDPMAQMILKYIWLTSESASPTVQDIYRVERHGEGERLVTKDKGERRLLWHGSSNSNLLSILSKGLVISPPDARLAGSRFGKGIYFAEYFSKSKTYIDSDVSNFMLLCEVVLGETLHLTSSNQDDLKSTKAQDCDSVMAQGSKVVKDWLKLENGVSIPQRVGWLGTGNVSYHTEYVVKDPAQVCLRYLIQYS